MLKGFGLGAFVVGLIALVAVAVIRETAAPKPQPVAATGGYGQAAERPAISAEDEAYARAMWPIHSQVKQDAVAMTFTGLAYKMGDIKKGAMKERLAPLIPRFGQALTAIKKLQPPASMRSLHEKYVEAIGLYRDASVVMVRVAADGDDKHLIEAQEMTQKASSLTLMVGETLWPGEYKPN